MHALLLALAGPSAIVFVLGAVVAWDRLREPHRDPARPCAVVDSRTLRDAARRYERLQAHGDPAAWHVAVAACVWLRDEIHTGPRRRRVARAVQLEQWKLLAQQACPLGDL